MTLKASGGIRALEKTRAVRAPRQKLGRGTGGVRMDDEMGSGCASRRRRVVVSSLRLVPRSDVHVRGAPLSDRDHRRRVRVTHHDEGCREQARQVRCV